MPKKFSVLDMAQQAQFEENKEELDELFNNKEEVKVVEEVKAEIVESTPATQKEKKPWAPDKKLLEDLPEMTKDRRAIYKKEEMIEESFELKNGTEEEAKSMAANAKNEMERSRVNIEYAKQRWGWGHTAIPKGEWEARILIAAQDPDFNSAQQGIDELFDLIEKEHPEFITTRINNENPVQQNTNPQQVNQPVQQQPQQEEIEVHNKPVGPNTHEPSPRDNAPVNYNQNIVDIVPPEDKVNVVIDKSQSKDVSWTEEEIKKLQKARTVELNIREEDNLNFADIEDIDSDGVSKVISQYVRKTNDIDAPLPASRYRATFKGLSYPEILDLNNSNRINSLDAEKLKWSIVFDHMSNMSIGDWEEYDYYLDEKGNEVRIVHDNVPKNIGRNHIRTHTKFDDFLKKTSFIDIEYLIWKVLCATSMENELLSVTCNSMKNGVKCGNSYDWIYSPNDLLLVDEIDPQVLEEMKITTDASTQEDIMKNFMGSPVMSDSTVELPHSHFRLIFGHISGYDFLTNIFGEMQQFNEENIDPDDPRTATNVMTFTMLSVIKGILVEKQGGGYYRIKKSKDITDILHTLDEVDWQVAYKIFTMMTDPYQLKYELRDMVCPKCHHKSNVSINNMSDLLFLTIQSLASVEIELTRI